MAGVAYAGAADVARRYAMATGTSAQHLIMINRTGNHRCPGGKGTGVVASLAHIGAVNVSRTLVAGNHAVMTGGASPCDLRMIHRAGRHRQPGRELRRFVAGITLGASVNVACRQAMACATCPQHLIMIHRRRRDRRPAREGAAVVAGLADIR